jgi:hypothetical protein
MVQAASASQRKQGSGRTGPPTLHSA